MLLGVKSNGDAHIISWGKDILLHRKREFDDLCLLKIIWHKVFGFSTTEDYLTCNVLMFISS
jgi:hypothetical protein